VRFRTLVEKGVNFELLIELASLWKGLGEGGVSYGQVEYSHRDGVNSLNLN